MSQQDIKILGFAPDLDITTPGIILNSTAIIPTINGIANENYFGSAGYPALASACRGAAVCTKIDNTTRYFATTQTKIYEGNSGAYTDVSAGGGSYTGGASNLWRFTQFGNDTIATNRTDPMQISSSSGAFSNLGGSPPKASIVETVNGQVMAFDYNDGTNDYPDGWYCSALQNDASWVPSIATGAANGRLLDAPGQILGGKRLGDQIVAYKQNAMFLGMNVGPPVIWQWQLIPGSVGAVSQEAIQSVLINDIPTHIFCGFDGFYSFDGTRPRYLGKYLRKWFSKNVSAQYRNRIKSLHDPINSLIRFYLPDSGGNLSMSLIYNYVADRWVLDQFFPGSPVQATVEYLSPGITYDALGSSYSTYDSLPATSYDSTFAVAGQSLPGFFGGLNQLLTYGPAPSVFGDVQFGYIGTNDYFQTLTRIRPRFNSYPSPAASPYVQIRSTPTFPPDSVAYSAFVNFVNGKHDMLISSKWFSPEFSFPVTNYEMTGFSMFFEQDGEE